MSLKHLADAVDKMILGLKAEYEKRNIQETPFVFVKNNAGTYGLYASSTSDLWVQVDEYFMSWAFATPVPPARAVKLLSFLVVRLKRLHI